MAKLEELRRPGHAALRRPQPGGSGKTSARRRRTSPNFARAGDPGPQTLGDAGADRWAEARRLRSAAHRPERNRHVRRPGRARTSPRCWTPSSKTQGFQNLMDFIYNTSGAINGFDAFGHFLRSNLQVTNCIERRGLVRGPGLRGHLQPAHGARRAAKKKKQEGARRRARHGLGAGPPRRCRQPSSPAADRPLPQPAPEIRQLSPGRRASR